MEVQKCKSNEKCLHKGFQELLENVMNTRMREWIVEFDEDRDEID